MSNGSPKGAWEDVPLDPDTLMSAVAAQTAAVEDAGGDVKAANVRLREAVMEAQAEVSSARERLGVRQQEVIRNLTDMGLMGRAIRITAGTSLATGYYHEDDEIRTREVAEPVDGISGTITGFETGTLFGRPIEPARVVLHVAPDGTLDSGGLTGIPEMVYAIDAASSDYLIREAPQP